MVFVKAASPVTRTPSVKINLVENGLQWRQYAWQPPWELLGRRGPHLYLAIELRHPRWTIAGG
jgi:hypothetical protein